MEANRSQDLARTTFQLLALEALSVKRGGDLPILVVFAGVVGLFIGPVVLAVAYIHLVDWMGESAPSAEQEQSTPALQERR